MKTTPDTKWMKALAWIGSACFALSAIPAAYEALKSGYCDYPWAFLIMWLIGELCLAAYLMIKREWVIVGLNYGVNLVCLIILISLKLF